MSRSVSTTQHSEQFAWHDFPFGGVLEAHESLTAPGPALELHIIQRRAGVVAFWMLDDGRFGRRVSVGST